MLSDRGFGYPENCSVDSMAVYNSGGGEKLYLGTHYNGPEGCQVWSYDGEGFSPVATHGITSPSNTNASSMAVYQGTLVVGTFNNEGCQVLSYDGSGWSLENTPGFDSMSKRIASPLAVASGQLFSATNDRDEGISEVWSTSDVDYRYAWYLPEGSTGSNQDGSGFETFVVVQNPGTKTASTRVTFQTPAGSHRGPASTLGPGTRKTVNVGDYVPGEWSVSAKVESDEPVVAERSTYWSTPGVFRQAAHDSIGINELSRTWYLPEGSTGVAAEGSFSTWVLVQNPGDEEAAIRITFNTPEGEVPGPSITLSPGTRETVDVARYVPGEWSVSAKVESDKPVAAERSTYWSTPRVFRQAAHDSIGVAQPALSWYLPEGSTGVAAEGSFATWVLVQNPGTETATVRVTFQTPDRLHQGPVLELKPGTRDTVEVARTLPNMWSVSTMIESDVPVVAERTTYWNTSATLRQAAHASIGASRASTTWDLAEGCTATGPEGSFATWVLVQNPGTETAAITITYQTPGGQVPGPEFNLAPGTRRTVDVSEYAGAQWSVSSRVSSNHPVISERSTYWNTPATLRQAAHASIGMPQE